jgi:hypothetical protein
MKKDLSIPDDIGDLQGNDARFMNWHKSPNSEGASGCVEVGTGRGEYSGFIGVRDSKSPQGPALAFTPHEWSCFIEGVKGGFGEA